MTGDRQDGENTAPFGVLEFLTSEAITFGSVVAIFLTIASFLLTVLQYGFVVAVAAALTVVVAFESYWIYVLHKRLRSIETASTAISEETEDFLRRLAMSSFLNEDERVLDTKHRYTFRQETYDISGTDCKMELHAEGHNASDSISQSVRTKIADDSPLITDEMDFTARQGGKEVPWEIVYDGEYEKIIETRFREPLQPGDSFDLTISSWFENTFRRRDEYVFFPVHHYERGVNRLVGRVVLDEEPLSKEVLEVVETESMNFEVSETQPEVTREDGRFVVEFEQRDPDGIYMMKFTRSDI
jgi:hypothetical protein